MSKKLLPFPIAIAIDAYGIVKAIAIAMYHKRNCSLDELARRINSF